MDWAMKMAAQVKKPVLSTSPWWVGYVESPVANVNPITGAVTYSGPLIIKVGEFSLRSDRLTLLDHYDQLHDGMRVALVGNIPGNQNFLVVGVIR